MKLKKQLELISSDFENKVKEERIYFKRTLDTIQSDVYLSQIKHMIERECERIFYQKCSILELLQFKDYSDYHNFYFERMSNSFLDSDADLNKIKNKILDFEAYLINRFIRFFEGEETQKYKHKNKIKFVNAKYSMCIKTLILFIKYLFCSDDFFTCNDISSICEIKKYANNNTEITFKESSYFDKFCEELTLIQNLQKEE